MSPVCSSRGRGLVAYGLPALTLSRAARRHGLAICDSTPTVRSVAVLMFGTCVGPGDRYERVAGPSISGVAERHDVVLAGSAERGICEVYNRFISLAIERPDCNALVLLHDDVEIIDPNFRAKVLNAVRRERAGVLGVTGGIGITGLSWWRARSTVGSFTDTRGFKHREVPFGEVDVVDGMLMVISRRAFTTVRFDEDAFPAFHGYDVDYCLAVKDQGLRVEVLPLDVLHHTKGGFGDLEQFRAADAALRAKWPQFVRPAPRREALEDLWGETYWWMRGQASRAAAVARARRPRGKGPLTALANGTHHTEKAPATGVGSTGGPASLVSCPACGEAVDASHTTSEVPQIVVCDVCGAGMTWPSPARDVRSEGLWEERYGGSRLARRTTWHREAALRLAWTQLYVPEGSLVEIGCGTGEYVKAAQDAGYDAYGVEVSEWAVRHARELGVRVVAGTFTDWVHEYEGFRPDVLAMWHVLEHVPDPLGLLTTARDVLSKDGVLVLEVPNLASSDAEILGDAWDGAQLTDHVMHFTPGSLRLLLERAGFAVDHVLPMTVRPYLSVDSWRAKKHETLQEGRPWPPQDLLRAVAVPHPPST